MTATAQLHLGDALTILPTLSPASVDAIITDPPYNSGGRTSSERMRQSSRTKYVSSDAQHDLAGFDGDNRDQRSYTFWLTLVLAEGLRVVKPGGACAVFTDWRQLPSTTDALQAAGWRWQGVLAWHKPITRPQMGRRFDQSCEFIVWGSAGSLDRTEIVRLPGLLTGSQPRNSNRFHITQKPLEVMRSLVRITPETGTVLDPFAGSGTTGVAALTEGRNFVGIEMSAHYHEVANQRLEEARDHTSSALSPVLTP